MGFGHLGPWVWVLASGVWDLGCGVWSLGLAWLAWLAWLAGLAGLAWLAWLAWLGWLGWPGLAGLAWLALAGPAGRGIWGPELRFYCKKQAFGHVRCQKHENSCVFCILLKLNVTFS